MGQGCLRSDRETKALSVLHKNSPPTVSKPRHCVLSAAPVCDQKKFKEFFPLFTPRDIWLAVSPALYFKENGQYWNVDYLEKIKIHED